LTNALTTTNGAGHLAAASYDDGFQPLTKYEEPAPARVDHLACISAGYMDTQKGYPVVSREGVIYMSDPLGRAPGLAAALGVTDGQSLTIALPSDNRRDFIHQHYRKEGKTRLEAFGDGKGITVLDGKGGRTFHAAGTPEFAKLVKQCKVSTDITFFLAGWEEDADGIPKPTVYFPDGLAPYRIRTSSEKSVNNLLDCIERLRGIFRGPIAGIPLEVRLVYPKVADPNGEKRAVPLFAFTFKPPVKMALNALQFREIAAEAAGILPGMAILSLPAPATLDEAVEEFEQDMLSIPLDAERARKAYFAIAGKTRFSTDEGRKEFLKRYTEGGTGSLKEFTEHFEKADPEELRHMLDALQREVDADLAGVDAETGEVIETTATVVKDEDPPAPPADPDANKLATRAQIDQVTKEMKRIGWGQTEGKAFLEKRFGKFSRLELTQAEIAEFITHLKGLQPATTTEEEGDA
jgi:hypothetical protein